MTDPAIISLCISGYAALISTGVFIWNVRAALNDKGKIKISGFFGYMVGGPGLRKKILYFEFVNSGTKAITASSFAGRNKKSAVKKGNSPAFIINTPGLPKKLEPGEVHQITFEEFGCIDDEVKSIVVMDTLGNKHYMSKKLLNHLKLSKKELLKAP